MLEKLRDQLAQLAYLAEREGLTDEQYNQSYMLLREYNRLLAADRRYKASVLRGLQRVTERDSGINDRVSRVKRVY